MNRMFNVLALENIEQSHLLEDPDLWKEFQKSLSNEDVPVANEDDDLEGTKGKQEPETNTRYNWGHILKC